MSSNQNSVLILGANGQLGSDLVQVFLQQALDFVALTRAEFDLSKDDVAKLGDYAPQYVINCIATTNVDGCEDDPDATFATNSVFVYNLAKFCNVHNITLLHISTDYVFNGRRSMPYTETDQPQPLNIYGLSKYTGELAIQAYHDKYFILRVSSLFGKAGASGKGGNFVTTMLRLGRERDRVEVVADQITCPTATLDIARCISYVIQHKIVDYGIYNCVSQNSCSWFDFTREIFKLAHLDVEKVHPAEFSKYKFKAKRPQYGVLDTTKLAKYYSMPAWQTSLAEYITAIT